MHLLSCSCGRRLLLWVSPPLCWRQQPAVMDTLCLTCLQEREYFFLDPDVIPLVLPWLFLSCHSRPLACTRLFTDSYLHVYIHFLIFYERLRTTNFLFPSPCEIVQVSGVFFEEKWQKSGRKMFWFVMFCFCFVFLYFDTEGNVFFLLIT